MVDKYSIRRSILGKRGRLTKARIETLSKIICQKVLSLDKVMDKEHFSLYLAINKEVDTKMIINELFKLNKNINVACYKRGKTYFFAKFTNWQNLEKGPYGIFQPKNPSNVAGALVDVAIIPGVAFSKSGVRLGYGKGVFDKLLSKTKTFKIGLAYEFQIVDKIPQEQHDLVMDLVVTEENIY